MQADEAIFLESNEKRRLPFYADNWYVAPAECCTGSRAHKGRDPSAACYRHDYRHREEATKTVVVPRGSKV